MQPCRAALRGPQDPERGGGGRLDGRKAPHAGLVQVRVTFPRPFARTARGPEGGPRGRKDLAGGVSRRNPGPSNPQPRRGVRNLHNGTHMYCCVGTIVSEPGPHAAATGRGAQGRQGHPHPVQQRQSLTRGTCGRQPIGPGRAFAAAGRLVVHVAVPMIAPHRRRALPASSPSAARPHPSHSRLPPSVASRKPFVPALKRCSTVRQPRCPSGKPGSTGRSIRRSPPSSGRTRPTIPIGRRGGPAAGRRSDMARRLPAGRMTAATVSLLLAFGPALARASSASGTTIPGSWWASAWACGPGRSPWTSTPTAGGSFSSAPRTAASTTWLDPHLEEAYR